jgi:DNA-binding transcriptional MerR regulator
MGRLRYWEETGLVVPSNRRQLSPQHTVRLYSFADLLSLLVVAELRTERGMSLQHVRRAVEHLRSRGHRSPLRELTFATLGGEIYFQHPDGTWEGDLRPDQVVLEEVLRLDRLRARITRVAERQADDAGQGAQEARGACQRAGVRRHPDPGIDGAGLFAARLRHRCDLGGFPGSERR